MEHKLSKDGVKVASMLPKIVWSNGTAGGRLGLGCVGWGLGRNFAGSIQCRIIKIRRRRRKLRQCFTEIEPKRDTNVEVVW